MSCSCRTLALRTFVRNIAQLHVSESGALSQTWLRNRAAGSSAGALRQTEPVLHRQYGRWARGLHTTTIRNDQAHDTAEASPVESKNHSREHENATATSAGNDVVGSRPPSKTADTVGSNALDVKKAYDKKGRSRRLQTKVTQATKPSTGAKRKQRPMMQDADQGRENEDNKDATHERETWQVQKQALKEKFPGGWQPRKRLSPDALAGIRALHAQFPEEYNTQVLAEKFEVSPEAIRRILKSKWEPSPEEEEERQERWYSRGKQVWSRYAELGLKPPKKWREEGIRTNPAWFERRRRRRQLDEDDDLEAGGVKPKSRVSGMSVQRKLAQNLL